MSGFGYPVSRRQRERDIAQAQAWIDTIDRALAAGVTRDGLPDLCRWSLTETCAVFPVIAERCGLNAEDVVCLKWMHDIDCDEDAPGDWYGRAERIAAWLDAAFGTQMHTTEELKKSRSFAVRRRGSARRAIADGRAA